MKIKMDYGRHGLTIDAPEESDVFTVRDVAAFVDEASAIRNALNNPIMNAPLETLCSSGIRVLLIHSDITRATPNHRLLPVIIDQIEKNGVNRKDITLINALGTHRPQTQQELISLLGADIVANYRCVQHNAYDKSQLMQLNAASLKRQVMVNRLLFESDLVILTGFIEPHFFAGYSGGPKAIMPGLAGAESILNNHSPEMIGYRQATFDITDGNPLWEEMKSVAECIPNTFLVNLTLNRENQITGVFTGDVVAAHQTGCKFVRDSSQFRIAIPYDVVITSNSGYPLDQNLYQCVKGMAAAKNAVREGGAILLLAACEEGLPDDGAYAQLLREAASPDDLLQKIAQPGYYGQDAWQAQIQALVQRHADVYIFSDGLDQDQVHTSLLSPCRDLLHAIPELIQKYGPRVCVLPQGPLTILELTS